MIEQGWGRIVSGLGARQTGNVFGSIRNVAAMTKNLADKLGPAEVEAGIVAGITIGRIVTAAVIAVGGGPRGTIHY